MDYQGILKQLEKKLHEQKKYLSRLEKEADFRQDKGEQRFIAGRIEGLQAAVAIVFTTQSNDNQDFLIK